MRSRFKPDLFYKAVQVPGKLHLFFEGHNAFDNETALTEDQKRLAAEMFRGGRKPWYIASELNMPPHQIYNYLRRRTDKH